MRTILSFSLITLLVILLCSCSKVYYVGEIPEQVTLYSQPDVSSSVVTVVKPSTRFIVKKRSKTYTHVIYENHEGYLYQSKFVNYHRLDKADGILYGYTTDKTKSSNYSSSSKSSTKSTGGSVRVKGYYRKNGTYVSPHTRSTPTKRH